MSGRRQRTDFLLVLVLEMYQLIWTATFGAIVVSDTVAGMFLRATFILPLAWADVIDTDTLITWASLSLF
jgi:hypothetical protein